VGDRREITGALGGGLKNRPAKTKAEGYEKSGKGPEGEGRKPSSMSGNWGAERVRGQKIKSGKTITRWPVPSQEGKIHFKRTGVEGDWKRGVALHLQATPGKC